MKEKPIMAQRIRDLRKAQGLTQAQLAEKIGLKEGAIRSYENGLREPNSKAMAALELYFHVTGAYLRGEVDEPLLKSRDPGVSPTEEKLDDTRLCNEIVPPLTNKVIAPILSKEALKIAEIYDSLDDKWKAIFHLLADKAELQAKEKIIRYVVPSIHYTASRYSHPMSAGLGEEAGDDGPEDFMLVKQPPRGTSFVAPVSGDSMEPTFHSGDELFVHACSDIEPGQIGVFFMDGMQWVKELGDGVLISHNPKYPPIPMTEDIRCQGLVLGVCDSSYMG